MNMLIKNITNLKTSDKTAILLCSTNKILDIKTYKEIYEISKKIFQTMEQFLKNTTVNCVGLLMDKNVYLPSIIISLLNLKCPFTYISAYIPNEDNVHMDYILSMNEDDIKGFKRIYELKIDEVATIYIWKNDNTTDNINRFDDIFCSVTTSGSTGKKKIVNIPYYCIESNALCLGKVFKISSNDNIFWGTPLSFDPSLIELMLALLNGATLTIVPQRVYINPPALSKTLFDVAKVTVLQMVPSVFLRWNEHTIDKIFQNSSLRLLALGGELFPKSLLKFQRNKSVLLFNLYGVTELSCWATVYQIDENTTDDISIGDCLNETVLKVCDEDLMEISEGIGEIYIGSYTRKCYINDEPRDSTLPIFRASGDLALLKNGKLYYKGRKNNVIKRFGHKINLAQIEETIFETFGLESRCVWSQQHKKILAFIVIKENHNIDVKERILDKLRSKLIHALPENSFPDYFDIIQQLPITSHGKVDTNKLETFYTISTNVPNGNVLHIFINLWCKYLGVSNGDTDYLNNYTFFEMGGNSISLMQLIEEFRTLTNNQYTDEIIAIIFEKKFADCVNVVKQISKKLVCNVECEKSMDFEITVKRPKIQPGEIEILWKYDLKACVDSSPLVFKDKDNNLRIAAGSFCNIFVILDKDGKEIFKDVLNGSIESTSTISPCLTYLYVGCYENTMYCFDLTKGRRIWEFKTGDKIKSSPVFCEKRNSIIFGSYDKHVYSLLSLDGSLCWKTEVDGSISSNLLLDETFGIFVTTTHGTCFCLQPMNGKIKWKYPCGSPIFGTPYLLPTSQIVVPSVLGVLYCLFSENGDLAWKFQADEVNSAGCSLIQKIWLDCEISSTPCIFEQDTQEIICCCNDGTVHFVDFQHLSVMRQIKLPGAVFSSPVVYDRNVYIGCRDNNLYCLLLK
ncbi:beta-alanine-activating enzyme isoform X2 [Diabrotica virgifera virgifera]|uniref:Beta-alanine-activating enzyme-like isoform X2 n=1 Tax=Diabrotica virgifera virgifera TaxID=50390 RepID=A0A6P7FA54_DIAVI|nr:beta-alanine-activating enzyme isoform X2 [Diabrotica virgifera virgifera]